MPEMNGGKPKPQRRRGPRTTTEVFDPILEANKLRLRSTPWAEIAALTGYPSAMTARLAVETWRREEALSVSVDERREAYQETIAFYNHFIGKWFDRAEQDPIAAATLLRYAQQRDRVRGLDRAKEETGTGMVLVIGGDKTEYLEGLEQVIADPN